MSDIGIQVTSVPMVGVQQRKPAYLVKLIPTDKRKKEELFISLDKPTVFDGFIEVKGFFVENKSEQGVIQNYSSILTSASKELISEMMFPWHRICSVRNLIFRAK